MKRITSLYLLLILAFATRAGFVIGYQAGMYTPKIANTAATMYYYNKVYGASFHNINLFNGIFIGLRVDDRKSWFNIAWDKKQNTFSSEYNGTANEKYKFSIRTKMNELVLDGGLKNKDWGFGIGINLANFDVLTKRAKVSEFSVTKWGHEYGTPIKLGGLPDNPSFSCIIEKRLSNAFIFRMSYHFQIAPVKLFFGTSDWAFKTNNLTFTLMLNLKKSKR